MKVNVITSIDWVLLEVDIVAAVKAKEKAMAIAGAAAYGLCIEANNTPRDIQAVIQEIDNGFLIVRDEDLLYEIRIERKDVI
jgi:hypothetical protein